MLFFRNRVARVAREKSETQRQKQNAWLLAPLTTCASLNYGQRKPGVLREIFRAHKQSGPVPRFFLGAQCRVRRVIGNVLGAR